METDTTDKCIICYDDIIGKKNLMTTVCEHQFHATCMVEYARNADVPTVLCPVCRHPLFDVSEVVDADGDEQRPLACGQIMGGIALVAGTLIAVNMVLNYCTGA